MKHRTMCLLICALIVSIGAFLGCATLATLSGAKTPVAEISCPGLISLPHTFKDVWYRAEDRGFALKAYSSSGTLSITTTLIEFHSESDSLRIPIADVQSIAWGKIGGDIANDWAIVRYTKNSGTTSVLFKDGSELGSGGNSGNIYSTLKYAIEVVGGVASNPESFYSGWVKKTIGGLMATEGKLTLTVGFVNKSPATIWVKTTFKSPLAGGECTVVEEIGSGGNKLFSCPQNSIVADSPYLLLASVYTDKDLHNLVENDAASSRWSQKEINGFSEALKSMH